MKKLTKRTAFTHDLQIPASSTLFIRQAFKTIQFFVC